MPILLTVDTEAGLRTHTVSGKLSLEELRKTLSEVYNSKDFDPDMNVIWDLVDADTSSFTTQDIETLIRFVSDKWGTAGTSRAALVVSKDVTFGQSRMYEMLSHRKTKSSIMVFRNKDEALNWINKG